MLTFSCATWVVRTCGYWPPAPNYACAKTYVRVY